MPNDRVLSYSTSSLVDLARRIRTKKERGIRACVLLGAGASATAGIPLAGGIVAEIRRRHRDLVEGLPEGSSYVDHMARIGLDDRIELIRELTAQGEVNCAHLFLASLVQQGFVDRILTTNFDPLTIKALAYHDVFPAIQDLTESRHLSSPVAPAVFFLHGRHNVGSLINAGAPDIGNPVDWQRQVESVLQEGADRRIWIVVGYSGINDRVFDCLRNMMDERTFRSGFYWVGYKDEEPAEHIRSLLGGAPDAYHVKGYDADTFFVGLARELRIGPPDILVRPFSYLQGVLAQLADMENTTLPVSRTFADVATAIEHIERPHNFEIVSRSREALTHRRFEDISRAFDWSGETLIERVKSSPLTEPRHCLVRALRDWAQALRTDNHEDQAQEKDQWADDLGIGSYDLSIGCNKDNPSRGYQYVIPEHSAFYTDPLTLTGLRVAEEFFGTPDVKVIGRVLFHKDRVHPHVHRIYVPGELFRSAGFKGHPTEPVNILKTIVASRKDELEIEPIKSHKFVSTMVGADAEFLHDSFSPALIHVQATYALWKNQVSSADAEPFPIELLVTKYLRSVHVAGLLTDRAPREIDPYSRLAEDLFPEGPSRERVVKHNNRYHRPWFGFDKHARAIASPRPDRLLRIMLVPEEACNYHCVYCCFWNGEASAAPGQLAGHLASHCDNHRFEHLARAAVASGCNRVMLTGGEPFLAEGNELKRVVRQIASVDGLSDFWITTNGSKLTKGLVGELKEAGLKGLVVTLPSADAEAYGKLTAQTQWGLADVLAGIEAADAAGLPPRVDVPLCRGGITSLVGFEDLVKCVYARGVKKIAYFPLHRTKANERAFDSLFINPDDLTSEMWDSPHWAFNVAENGQRLFQHEDVNVQVIVPADPQPNTTPCRRLRCGTYCQGTYAAYAMLSEDRVTLRACHREFGKQGGRLAPNEWEVHYGLDFKKALAPVMKRIWHYAYERVEHEPTLFFDLDDTLIPNHERFCAAKDHVAIALAKANPKLEQNDAFKQLDRAEQDSIERGNGMGPAHFRTSLLETSTKLAPHAHEAVTKAVDEAMEALLTAPIEPYADAEKAIEELHRRGYRLFVLTRGDETEQRRRFEALRFKDRFERLIVVREKTKDTFLEVLRANRCSRQHTVMIGNSQRADIAPARAAGVHTILATHGRTWSHEHDARVQAEREVSSLYELVDVLSQLAELHE